MEEDLDNFKKKLNDKSYYNKLNQKIKYFSSFVSSQNSKDLLFNRLKYQKEKIKNFNNSMISNIFIEVINEYEKHKKNNDIIFITNIICKLYNENFLLKDELLKIAKYFLDKKLYNPFFEIFHRTQINDLFTQLQTINLSKLDKLIIKTILLKNPKYIKCILSLESEKYKPYKFISSLFKLQFNLNLLSIEDLLIEEFKYENNTNVFPENYILNIFKTLNDLFENEEKLQKVDVIYGLYTINGFKYSNSITLVEKFNINISFKIYENQKENVNEYIIFKLFKDKNNDYVKLYFDKKFNIKLKYFSKEFILLQGKNIDFNFIHSMKILFVKESGWLNGYTQKIKVILNGQELNFDSNTLIEGEECNLCFGEFNGELTEFNIMEGKKEIFKLNILSIFNLYKDKDLFQKEFIIDSKNSKLIELDEIYMKKNIGKINKEIKNIDKKIKEKEELNFTNYFFENKKAIKKFFDENGFEYIISLFIYLTKEILNDNDENSKNEIKDIYEIIFAFWDLFQKLFNMLLNLLNTKENNKSHSQNYTQIYYQKLMTLLYGYSILQNTLSEKTKMPELLINRMIDFLKTLKEKNNDKSPIINSLFNHILMIVLSQQNAYNIQIGKLSSFFKNLISSKEQNYYIDCYISILIELFFNQKDLKETKQILLMFINNFSDSLLIKYIIIFQQFALNNESKSEKNYEISYKLLKLIYKSKICEKTNILDKPDIDIILFNFQQIFHLEMDDKNILKENEEKEIVIENFSDFEESEEYVSNYLTKLKSMSIRIIDNFIIKKYRNLGKKSMLVKDERYNKVKNSIALLFSINNLDLYIMRSLLLISFDTPNEHALRFIKYGFGHEGVNISELKLIESFTSIKFMFSIFDILKNKNQINDYFEFIKLLMGETMKKIRLFANSKESNLISYKKNYSMNIFEFKKIGILLNNIIIELKRFPDNSELNFNEQYLITIIENILFLHPNPFFFNLALELVKDYIKDENSYEYNYIVKMMEAFVNLLNYKKIEKNQKFSENNYLFQNFNLNCIKYISLVNEIIHLYIDEDNIKAKKFENNIISENDENENENILKFVITNFMIFLDNNLLNPLIYSSIIANKEKNKIIIEMILDIFYLYNLYDSNEEKKIIEILNKIIYPEFLEKIKQKKYNTIFCFIDLYKEMHSNKVSENKKLLFINKIYDIEQQLLKTREINIVNYFFSLKILKLIILEIYKYNKIHSSSKHKKNVNNKPEVNEEENIYYNFLVKLKSELIEETNIHYLKDITKKYRIKTLDREYNKFRVKVENCLLRNENLENVLFKYISDITEFLIESDSDNISIYSSKNIEIETDDKSVISTNSSISIKPSEKFHFKNPEIIQEKNFKYDSLYKKMNINNIKFWIEEINVEGLLLIYKNNKTINRSIFSSFINKEDLYDEKFINKIIPEFHNYTHYKNNSQKNNNILYPTESKNYITSIYTKPFLKPYKKLYSSSSFSVSHKYYIHLKQNDNSPKKEIKIPFIFDEIKEIQCELITIKGTIYCNLYIKDNLLIIKNNKIKVTNPKDLHLFSSNQYIEKDKLIIIPYIHIKEIITRRFLYMYQACEIFTIDNKSYLINFFERGILLDKFYAEIKKLYPSIQNKIIENAREYFENMNFINDWNNNKINNFYFLNMLNKYSSRSYNDLQQYPLFPWIFIRYPEDFFENKKYHLIASLQKNNQKLFFINKRLYHQNSRLFQYPISAQNEEKREELEKKYDKSFQKFKTHFNSHYSTNSSIFYFLVRISPYTEGHIKFQGGQFDKTERMYFGPDNFLKIAEISKDNREPIPEMFYFYEMYLNMNYNYFGYSNSKKKYFNNVIFSDEKISPFEFVYLNRALLNSDFISENINLWINNIFGVKQLELGDYDKMRSSCNVYSWYSYEKIFRKYYEKYKINKETNIIKSQIFKTPKKLRYNLTQIENDSSDDEFIIDNNNIKEQLITINLFGQCPVEILKKYLSQKGKNSNTLNPFTLKKRLEVKNDDNEGIKKISIDSNILYISYDTSSDYIIYITNKNILYVISKKDFSEKYKFSIIGNFIPLTSSITINYNNCETIIISNIMEEKIILADKGKLKYQHKILDIPTCLCKKNSEYFFIGTLNGFIQRIKISFQKGKDNQNEIESITDEKYILGHKYKLVREIIYNDSLNILISLGDDNRIFIRNEEFYEVLTIIDLSFYLNKNILSSCIKNIYNCCNDFFYGNRILLNSYDTLYYINDKYGCVISFTLNGLVISKKLLLENKNYFSPYLIYIYDEFRFLYLNILTKQIVELNPVNFDEIFFTYDLNKLKIDDKNEIKALFYNEKNKRFNIWIRREKEIQIIDYNLNEQFDKINIKDIDITKENIIKSISKKQKMEKFAQNIFKTTIHFASSKKNKNKNPIS